MKNLLLLMVFVLLGTPLLSACVKGPPLPLWISKIPAMVDHIRPDEILRLPEGDQINFVQLLNDLDTARVIFVGESHDQIEHHRIQVRVLQGLLEKGKDAVVAMEMFERSQQPILDRWSQGLLTEEEFLKEVQWEKTWSMDYELYKGIFDEAKNHHLSLIH